MVSVASNRGPSTECMASSLAPNLAPYTPTHYPFPQQTGELGEALAARIVSPLLRMLSHCTAGAHAALLDTAAALVEHSPRSLRAHAHAFAATFTSAASASDWGARRAAADGLRALASHQPEAAASAQHRVMQVLNSVCLPYMHAVSPIHACGDCCVCSESSDCCVCSECSEYSV